MDKFNTTQIAKSLNVFKTFTDRRIVLFLGPIEAELYALAVS